MILKKNDFFNIFTTALCYTLNPMVSQYIPLPLHFYKVYIPLHMDTSNQIQKHNIVFDFFFFH